MGDTNDPKCLGFHSAKPRKVRGGSTSPEGRAVLHQAAVESFVCGQELRCAKEGLCMTKDAQLMTRFRGQLGDLSQERSWQIMGPRSLNERTSSRGLLFQMVLLERHSESVRFVNIERHVPRVGPVCDFIQICRE